MGWTRGPDRMEKIETAIDMGGLREDNFGGSRRGVEIISE